MKLIHVVGARPNFMKAAPVMAAIAKRNSASQILIHTGQHYDRNMSEVFFKQLGMPEPEINLEVGSGTHAWQTAQIMMRIESILLEKKPDFVLVYGDVNSTVSSAIVCSKLQIPVCHVEAGLRSFDRTMPEEINRLLTDQIADFLFTPSKDGDENLLREGIGKEKIHFVGNVMIDTLVRLRKMTERYNQHSLLAKTYNLPLNFLSNDYGLITLHRPSNVDEPKALAVIMNTLGEISDDIPIIFPLHPRTRFKLKEFDIQNRETERFKLIDPVGYLDFLFLQERAKFVITDSGGIQEETTFLGVPCLTVRENTERPVTVDIGTNILVGQNMKRLKSEVRNILNGHPKKGIVPELWDGMASERIADVILG